MSYARQARGVLATLKRKGVTITLRRGATEYPAVAAILPATVGRDLEYDAASLVRQNRRQLVIAGLAPDGTPLAIEPKPGDLALFEGTTWGIPGASRIAPDGGQAIAFVTEVER